MSRCSERQSYPHLGESLVLQLRPPSNVIWAPPTILSSNLLPKVSCAAAGCIHVSDLLPVLWQPAAGWVDEAGVQNGAPLTTATKASESLDGAHARSTLNDELPLPYSQSSF